MDFKMILGFAVNQVLDGSESFLRTSISPHVYY